MPRKSSRSGNESRPTRRNLNSRLDSLADGASGGEGLPHPTADEILSGDPVPVDTDRGIYQFDGGLRQFSPPETPAERERLADVMRDVLSSGDTNE